MLKALLGGRERGDSARHGSAASSSSEDVPALASPRASQASGGVLLSLPYAVSKPTPV
jgi:hypothetical protein